MSGRVGLVAAQLAKGSGSRRVLLARGRGYADVRPLSGVYSGPAAGALGRHRRSLGSADLTASDARVETAGRLVGRVRGINFVQRGLLGGQAHTALVRANEVRIGTRV
jgi:hypothetical protein